MNAVEKEIGEDLADALKAANYVEFHEAVALILGAADKGGLGPEDALRAITLLFGAVTLANQRLDTLAGLV